MRTLIRPIVVIITTVLMSALLALGSVAPASAGAGPGVASAAPVSAGFVPMAADEGNIPGSTRTKDLCGNATITQDLPVDRWTGAMDKHTRLGTVENLTRLPMNTIQIISMNIGNFLYSTSTALVGVAFKTCPIQNFGGLMDRLFANIAGAFLSSPLMAFFGFLLVMSMAWRSYRGRANMSQIFQKVLVLALMAVMVSGAVRSTGGGINGSTEAYKPGMGSPGWFITTIDGLTGELTGAVADSVARTGLGDFDGHEQGALKPTYDPQNKYSCETYIGQLRDEYRRAYRSLGSERGAFAPIAISRYWEATGLQTWKRNQFGSKNNYANIMYCRALEVLNDADASDIIRIQRNAVKGSKGDFAPKAPAWRTPSSKTARDRLFVAWAACSHGNGANTKTGWSIPADGNYSREKLLPGNRGHEDGEKACNRIFNDASDTDDFMDALNAFDWETGADKIDDHDLASEADDFLLTMHGIRGSSNMIGSLVFMLCALLMAIVFILFAVAIIFGKLLMLMMILGVAFGMIFILLPSSDPSKVLGYGKQLVGIAFFVNMGAMLLTLLIIITNAFSQIGAAAMPGGQGSIMSMIWMGAAPLAAAIGLHMVFKQMGLPSPMSVTSAGAWGKAAMNGTVGGAAMSGAGAGAERLQNQLKSRIASAATGSLIGNYGANRMSAADRSKAVGSTSEDGNHQMNPVGTAPERDDEQPLEGQDGAEGKTGPEDGKTKESEGKAGGAKQPSGPQSKVAPTLKKWGDHEGSLVAGAAAAAGGRLTGAVRRAQEMGVKGMAGAAGSAVARKAVDVGRQFKEQPVRSLVKYGAMAGVVAATGGAAAPLVGLGMIAAGAKGGRKVLSGVAHEARVLGHRGNAKLHSWADPNRNEFEEKLGEAADEPQLEPSPGDPKPIDKPDPLHGFGPKIEWDPTSDHAGNRGDHADDLPDAGHVEPAPERSE